MTTITFYRYKIDDTTREVFDLFEIPEGINYDTIVEDIIESINVPEKVTAIQFLSALAFVGITENQILEVINSLEEPYRTIASVAFKRATIFERNNAFITMLQGYLNLSSNDVDELFINASKIII